MALNKINQFAKLMKIKGYSDSTVASYTSHLKLYAISFGIKNWETHTNKEILNNGFMLISQKQMAYSTQKQLIGALTLFYQEMFNRTVQLQPLKPTRKPNTLPTVFSQQEVKRLFNPHYS